MNEDDATKELSDRELLTLLHRTVSELYRTTSELNRTTSELNERVGRLEAKAYDTQPLPVNFDARFTALEERLDSVEYNLLRFRVETKTNFKLFREDFIHERRERADLEERLELLERPPH